MTTRVLAKLSNDNNISTITMNKNLVVLTHIINITVADNVNVLFTKLNISHLSSILLAFNLLCPIYQESPLYSTSLDGYTKKELTSEWY